MKELTNTNNSFESGEHGSKLKASAGEPQNDSTKEKCENNDSNNASLLEPINRVKSLLDDDSSDDEIEPQVESGSVIGIDDPLGYRKKFFPERRNLDSIFRSRANSNLENKENNNSIAQLPANRGISSSSTREGDNEKQNVVLGPGHTMILFKAQPEFQIPLRTNTLDDFIRHGSRFKSMLEGAMSEVKRSLSVGAAEETLITRSTKRARDPDDNATFNIKVSRRRENQLELDQTSKLAREKTALAINLERLLKDAQDQASVLKAANEALREEASSSQSRLERTAEQLRIAGRNASKARVDADAAEATALSLAHSLQSIQSVVTETKDASDLLQKEQEKVENFVFSVEAKVMRLESDLVRSQKDLLDVRSSNNELTMSAENLKKEKIGLELQIKQLNQEMEQLRRYQKEQEALENARKARASKMEQDYLQAQSLLVEACTAQEKAEQTTVSLKETIEKLQISNEEAHTRILQHQEESKQENSRLSEALFKVEKELLQVRIHDEELEEKLKRALLDKSALDRHIVELKDKVFQLQKRLIEQDAAGSTNNGESISTPETFCMSHSHASLFSKLPALSGKKPLTPQSALSNKDADVAANSIETIGNFCAICFKAAVGIMKTCQCGNSSCNIRAHVGCINRINPGPSVSHPGTPAPRLPFILCSHEMKTPGTRSSLQYNAPTTLKKLKPQDSA